MTFSNVTINKTYFFLISIDRLLLAALHYNENSDRLQAVTKDGRPCYTIRFPKFKKGEYSVRKEKTSATYGTLLVSLTI